VVVVGFGSKVVVLKKTTGPKPMLFLTSILSQPPQSSKIHRVRVCGYSVFVGPTSIGPSVKIVRVHGLEVGVGGEEAAVFFLTSLATTPEVEAGIVTVAVLRLIAQPLWHVGQGPSIVMVLVVVQHASLGGTKSVVVASRMHSGIGPHSRREQSVYSISCEQLRWQSLPH
jgi:hypothetical protein